MRKAKIFIASFLTILVVVMITLLFVFSRTLFEPWVELLLSHAKLVSGIIFVIMSFVIGMKKWAWWIKGVNLFIIVSMYSLTSSESIVELATNPIFQTGLIAFGASIILQYILEISVKYSSDTIDATYALLGITICVMASFILYPLFAQITSEFEGLYIFLTVLGELIAMALMYYLGPHKNILKLFLVTIILLSSVLLH